MGGFSIATANVDKGCRYLFKRMLANLVGAAVRRRGYLLNMQLASQGNAMMMAGRKRKNLSNLLLIGLGTGWMNVNAGSKVKTEAWGVGWKQIKVLRLHGAALIWPHCVFHYISGPS